MAPAPGVETDAQKQEAGTSSERHPGDGVRARLSISDPPQCAVAETVSDDATATDIRWTGTSDHTVEQFHAPSGLDAESIFTADDQSVYRLTDIDADDCPCRLIESLGYPIADASVTSQPTQLLITLLLPSPRPIVEIIDVLESRGVSVHLECLVRSMPDDDESIVIDTGRLTDRQREVLEVAHRMGYFSYPRQNDASTVAEELGIVRSTFTEHLAAAQRRLFEGMFDDR